MNLLFRNCMVSVACLLAAACNRFDDDQAEEAEVAVAAQAPVPRLSSPRSRCA